MCSPLELPTILAFNHEDFTKFAEGGAAEKRAIEVMGSALAGSDRPSVLASDVATLAPGKLATEESIRPSDVHIPCDPEGAAFGSASRDLRVSAVRLSPTKHRRTSR